MERERSSSSSTNFSFNKTLPIAEEESKKKQKKKVSFSEEDAVSLLEKYDANTVLTLLQEVASHPPNDWKINWNELVEKTSTGISSAKEYQMLWRHLAYGHPLIEHSEGHDAPPLDDDSDIECEREALPPVTKQTASEAAACVQVMIASVSLSQSTPTSSLIEAPLTINVPLRGSSSAPSGSSQPSNLKEETNIIFPVTVQRQLRPNVSSTSAIKTNRSVSDNTSTQNKRKAWSEEEDMQLRAAVQRWGEGNWVDMAGRDDFPIKRSPSQLSKRWNTLRKKGGGTN